MDYHGLIKEVISSSEASNFQDMKYIIEAVTNLETAAAS
jgi:hypothetical protein